MEEGGEAKCDGGGMKHCVPRPIQPPRFLPPLAVRVARHGGAAACARARSLTAVDQDAPVLERVRHPGPPLATAVLSLLVLGSAAAAAADAAAAAVALCCHVALQPRPWPYLPTYRSWFSSWFSVGASTGRVLCAALGPPAISVSLFASPAKCRLLGDAGYVCVCARAHVRACARVCVRLRV